LRLLALGLLAGERERRFYAGRGTVRSMCRS
jgi:hypothetical protein